MSAIDKVFTIPELLEKVLLVLPEKDLLLNQRVTKIWRDVVTTSPLVRRKLFFTAELLLPDADNPNYLKYNCFHYTKQSSLQPIVALPSQDVRYNPLLEPFMGQHPPSVGEYPTTGPDTPLRMDCPDASWRKMHWCDPVPALILPRPYKTTDNGYCIYDWVDSYRRWRGAIIGVRPRLLTSIEVKPSETHDQGLHPWGDATDSWIIKLMFPIGKELFVSLHSLNDSYIGLMQYQVNRIYNWISYAAIFRNEDQSLALAEPLEYH